MGPASRNYNQREVASIAAFRHLRYAGDSRADQGNDLNYQSACPWDIYSLAAADENVEKHKEPMAKDEMDDLHLRIARVTEDLRAIQRDLNCAAMQAPSDPELMETLNSLPETEAIQVLCKSLDQMRHFLWFYSQVMNNDPELGDKLRQSNASQTVEDRKVDTSFLDQLTRSDEALLLRYLVESKERKPN